eukprot:3563294-Prymnesium_polylepis.1
MRPITLISKLAKIQLVSDTNALSLHWTLAAPPCVPARARGTSPVQRPVAATEHARPVVCGSTAEG